MGQIIIAGFVGYYTTTTNRWRMDNILYSLILTNSMGRQLRFLLRAVVSRYEVDESISVRRNGAFMISRTLLRPNL